MGTALGRCSVVLLLCRLFGDTYVRYIYCAGDPLGSFFVFERTLAVVLLYVTETMKKCAYIHTYIRVF